MTRSLTLRPALWPAAVGPVAAGAAALAACAVLAAASPGDLPLPACPFKAITGLDCPGCGATRATRALLRGDIVGALDLNVLLVAVVPLAVWAWAAWLARSMGWPRPTALVLPGWAVRTIPVAIIAFWVVRNVPVAPFSALGT